MFATLWPSREYGADTHTTYLGFFAFLFLFRYTRVLLSILGNHRYRSVCSPSNPSYHARDVTVVIPTMDIMSDTFHHVVKSIMKHSVARIIITTAGPKAKHQKGVFEKLFSDPSILLLHRETRSRREQTAQAMKHVRSPLLILQDDHTYWPSKDSFLKSIVAPFEEPTTGAVGVVLEARHRQHPFSFSGFWNFLGMTYLVRRTFEYCGTYGIDGGLSTLAGRFGAFRSEIYASPNFLREYLDERVFFGLVGPLNADDDKFHTRWLIDHGWNIVLQAGPETTMTTELGEWPKFNEQILRWMRTSFRSNPRQLLHAMSWVRHPYTRFNLLVWFFRLSLIQEPLMFWLLHATLQAYGKLKYFKVAATALYMWVVAMKYNKISAQFKKHPRDIVYFPAYLVFGYWCTLVKLWAMLTWWNASWGLAQAADIPKKDKVAVSNSKGYRVSLKRKVSDTPESLSRRVRIGMGGLHHEKTA